MATKRLQAGNLIKLEDHIEGDSFQSSMKRTVFLRPSDITAIIRQPGQWPMVHTEDGNRYKITTKQLEWLLGLFEIEEAPADVY